MTSDSQAAPYLNISAEVRAALAAAQPVVALESTIVTHGMPYPDNVQTAQSVERIIRDVGAVPATIYIREGRIQVGVSDAELEQLAHATGVVKASRRDLPVVLAARQTASTTVAATMIAARLAGIRVFVTGGIGGVHRGAAQTMDVSADLEELARTDVIVVCARCQGDPRHRPDLGAAGDARGAGARVWERPVPRFLDTGQRLPGRGTG